MPFHWHLKAVLAKPSFDFHTLVFKASFSKKNNSGKADEKSLTSLSFLKGVSG